MLEVSHEDWVCLAEIPIGFGTQSVEDPYQCCTQDLPVDAFASCNLRDGESVDPEGTEPMAVVRLHACQPLDQPFALWISRLASLLLKTIDSRLWFRRPIAVAALTMQ